MEDINVMPGIDFKANQKRIKDRKKKAKLVNKILNGAIFLGLAIAVIGILFINKKMTDSALVNCQKLGHDYNYCISHL